MSSGECGVYNVYLKEGKENSSYFRRSKVFPETITKAGVKEETLSKAQGGVVQCVNTMRTLLK